MPENTQAQGSGLDDRLGRWRPIHTAPTDGTEVLVFCSHGQYVASYSEYDIEWWHVRDNKFGPYPLRGSAPTHWMPLPEPPAA